MLRKIIAALLIGAISMFTVAPSFGYEEFSLENYYQERLDEAAEEILSVKNGKELKRQLDVFFALHGENQKTLYKLDERLWEVEDVIYYEGSDEKTEAVIGYIRAKLNIALNEVYNAERKKQEEEKAKRVQEVLEKNISDSEIRNAKREILKLQNTMFEYGNETIENFIGDFEKYTKVQENGDFSMSVSIDDNKISGQGVSGNMNLNIDNYESKTNVFDSQFNGDMSASVSAKNQYDETLEMNGKAFFDFIQKDGVMYFYVDGVELNLEGEGIDEFNEVQEMLEQINDFSKEGKYIRIGDDELAQAFGNIQNLQPEKLFGDIKIATEIPFFEAYKKEGNEYFLKPTQHLCSTLKDMAGKFDPFFGGECTDAQYEKFLGEYVDMGGILSLILSGTENTLKYTLIENDVELVAEVVYNSSEISSIIVDITPNQQKYPGEGFLFEYKKGASITLEFIADEIEMMFDSVLTVKNEIYSMDGHLTIEGSQIGYLTMKKGDFEAGIDYITEGYDWNTGEYGETGKFTMKTNGAWNGQNFDTLDLNADYESYKNPGDTVSFEVDYGETPNSITGNLTVIESEETVFTIDISGEVMQNYMDIELLAEINKNPKGNIVFDIMYDIRDNKANADIEGDINIGGESFVNFNIKNTGTRKPFDGEITAPKEYIDFMELFQNNEIYY